MAGIKSNEEFFSILRGLIESWCDRRCLKALSRILAPYVAFSGLTDSWADLHSALKDIQAIDGKELTTQELETLHGLVSAAESALNRR